MVDTIPTTQQWLVYSLGILTMNACESIPGSTNAIIANLGCILEASNPFSKAILGCIVTDPQLRLGE